MALTDSLISYWKLDDATGQFPVDATASGNTLNQGNTITSGTGKINGGASFSGSGTWLSCLNTADLQLSDVDFTFALWIKLNATAADMWPISKGAVGNSSLILEFKAGPTQRFRLRMFGSAGFGNETSVQADTFGAPSTGTYYYVVAWHDATANTFDIQINDTAADSASDALGVLSETGNLKSNSRPAK